MKIHRAKKKLFALQAAGFFVFGGFLGVTGLLLNPVLLIFSAFFFFAGASIWKGVAMSGATKDDWEEQGGRGRRRTRSEKRYQRPSVSRKRRLSRAYSTLNLDGDATEEEVNSAYRERVKDVHPDVNESENAHEEFQEVKNAYETIKDRKK